MKIIHYDSLLFIRLLSCEYTVSLAAQGGRRAPRGQRRPRRVAGPRGPPPGAGYLWAN